MKNYNLTLSDISPKLAKEVKEIIRTDKGIEEFKRSKKANDLFKQGKQIDALKVMFGQDK